MPSATSPDLPATWRRFLTDVDSLLPRSVRLHCVGGFVLAVRHRLPRTTNDLDYIDVVPPDAAEALRKIAGRESPLARRHRLYFQHVGVVSLPESYADRLTGLLPDAFAKLKLFDVDAHDLALSKLARNHPIDREDVAYLARTVPLSAEVLRARYRTELRPIIIGDPAMHDRTLEMWIEAYVG
jgi:hypothetical protein